MGSPVAQFAYVDVWGRGTTKRQGSRVPFELDFPAFLWWPSWRLRCMTVIAVPSPPEKMSEVRLPPVRALDDFLLGSTRLAPPDLRDLQRWHNRVINNLLYYQSNYLLVLGVGLLLGGYFRPVLTLLSGALIALIFVGFVWAAENKAPVRRIRRNYPGTCLFAVLGAAYFLVSLFEGSATFLIFIALPIALVLVHASLRLRNLKNKIENKMESIGLKRTPVGLLLEAFGQEQEAGS